MKTRKGMLKAVGFAKWQGQFAYLENWQGTFNSEKKIGRSGTNSHESQDLPGKEVIQSHSLTILFNN